MGSSDRRDGFQSSLCIITVLIQKFTLTGSQVPILQPPYCMQLYSFIGNIDPAISLKLAWWRLKPKPHSAILLV